MRVILGLKKQIFAMGAKLLAITMGTPPYVTYNVTIIVWWLTKNGCQRTSSSMQKSTLMNKSLQGEVRLGFYSSSKCTQYREVESFLQWVILGFKTLYFNWVLLDHGLIFLFKFLKKYLFHYGCQAAIHAFGVRHCTMSFYKEICPAITP